MAHLIGNIKDRRLAYLEQACERYAIMAYEVLRRELAIGFKSVTYSYLGSTDDERVGTFVGTFVPWEQTDKYHHGHRATEIILKICADPDEDHWIFSGGIMRDIENGMIATIRFSSDARCIALNIPVWDEIRFASSADHGQEAVTQLHKEPWGNLFDRVTI